MKERHEPRERLKRNKTIPFLNVSKTETESWARIGRSTVFDLVLNAVTEENDFIEDEMATTDVIRYQPALSQELQANKGDAAFDHLYEMFKQLPTGEDVKKDLLIIFAGATNEEGDEFDAWKTVATLTLDHFDTVAEKIYFNFSISKITRGTATVEAGVPTFTAK